MGEKRAGRYFLCFRVTAMTLTEPELKLNIGLRLVASDASAGKSGGFLHVMREGIRITHCKSDIKYPQSYPQPALPIAPRSAGPNQALGPSNALCLESGVILSRRTTGRFREGQGGKHGFWHKGRQKPLRDAPHQPFGGFRFRAAALTRARWPQSSSRQDFCRPCSMPEPSAPALCNPRSVWS